MTTKNYTTYTVGAILNGTVYILPVILQSWAEAIFYIPECQREINAYNESLNQLSYKFILLASISNLIRQSPSIAFTIVNSLISPSMGVVGVQGYNPETIPIVINN